MRMLRMQGANAFTPKHPVGIGNAAAAGLGTSLELLPFSCRYLQEKPSL